MGRYGPDCLGRLQASCQTGDESSKGKTKRTRSRCPLGETELFGPDQHLGVAAVPGIQNQSGTVALEVVDRDSA